MNKCPKCNSYMIFHMEYYNGEPFIHYNCNCCGYSTVYSKSEYQTVCDTKTTITNLNNCISTSTQTHETQ
jgi:hypothetical protein